MGKPRTIVFIVPDATESAFYRQVLGSSCVGVEFIEITDALDLSGLSAIRGPVLFIVDDRITLAGVPCLIDRLRASHGTARFLLLATERTEEHAIAQSLGRMDAILCRTPKSLHHLPAVAMRLLREPAGAPPETSGSTSLVLRVVSEAGIAAVIAGPDGCVVEFNAAFRKLLLAGYDGEDSSLNLLEFGARPGVIGSFFQRALGSNDSLRAPLELRRADGTSVTLEVTSQAVPGPHGPLVMALLQECSIAEHQASLPADASRGGIELNQFVSMASHELQEPLRALERYTKLLAKEACGKLNGMSGECMTHILEGTSRMQSLVDDLLSYTRALTAELHLQPTNCEMLLGRVIGMLSGAIEECGAEITHDPLPTITADGDRLFSVFQNLITNAIKYRGDVAPRIHVSALKKENAWMFYVRDNGIGIPAEDQERIFETFTRLHTSREYPGTGVGLALARRIVGSHGGRIWVKSEPGKGSVFYFTIPVEAERSPSREMEIRCQHPE